MAIDTNNEKLAIMEMGNVWEPGLPLSPGAFGQDDQQQLVWGYPGILWGAPAALVHELLSQKVAVVRAVKTSVQVTGAVKDESGVTRKITDKVELI